MADDEKVEAKNALGVTVEIDIAGAKPLAKSVERVTEAGIDGARSFFGKLCMPAVEEAGLLLRDKVIGWRELNFIKFAEKTKAKLGRISGGENLYAHPRLIAGTIEEATLTDDGTLQDMWSSLLAASCSRDGRADDDIMFVGLLKQLSAAEARLLRLAADGARYIHHGYDIKLVGSLVATNRVIQTCGFSNGASLILCIRHMMSLDLLNVGAQIDGINVKVVPSDLGMALADKCQEVRPDRSPIATFESLSHEERALLVLPSENIIDG